MIIEILGILYEEEKSLEEIDSKTIAQTGGKGND